LQKGIIPEKIGKNIHFIKADSFNPFRFGLLNKVHNNPDSLTWNLFYYRNLDKILDRINPDLVHTILYFMPYSIQSTRYCRKHKIPLIISEEIQREPNSKVKSLMNKLALAFIERYTLRYADYIISSTKMGLDFQKSFFKSIDPRKFVQIPWPVDQTKYLKFECFSRKSNPLRLLMVARFSPYKDHITVINAIKILENKKIPFELEIVGTGIGTNNTKNIVLSKLSDLGLEKKVKIYKKVISEKELDDLYGKSDILLLASKYESYGMVVPEAMAHGCSVIVSDTVGAKFMVKDGINGYTFKTGSPNDLAEKIIIASKNVNSLKKNAKETMRIEFSDKKIVEAYGKIVSKVINNNSK
jgi:glycosyltransferase involved in cell wall biosynthesis